MMGMPSCRDMSRLVSESMERKLSFRQRVGVRIHLLMCSLCSRFRRQLLFLREIAQQLDDQTDRHDEPHDALHLSPEARLRIKKALQDEDT